MDLSPIPLPLLSFSWVFFISYTLVLQMAKIRNHNNNHNGDNNGENNQNVNPPPPPPPTLEQVLGMQAQMLQTMQQTMVNMQAAQPQAPPLLPRDRLQIFSALSRLLFLMLWSRCMLMIDSSLLRRSCRWCSAATMKRCC
jgi:hypothetical protein